MEELDKGSKRLKTALHDHTKRLDGEVQKLGGEEKRLRDKFHELDEKKRACTAANGNADASDDDLIEIAKRSKGTPRILNARLKWYQNYVLSVGDDGVETIFDAQGIDRFGMDVYDRLYVEVLEKNIGNPLGLKSISSLTGIATETIENSIEPYLVREGYVVRTQKGRVLGKRRK